MKLSIIIPCYNVENFVQNCTESIVMQQGFDFEMIMINDGSKDNTQQVLENLAEKDFRIKVINQQNQGLSGARNTGIEKATGEYIMFVDADDTLEPEALKTIADFFQEEDLFCFSYNRVFGTKKLPRKFNIQGKFPARFIQRRIVGLIDAELSDPSQTDALVTAWGKIYKTEIIRKNQIQFTDTKEIGTEDALFNIQYLEHALTAQVLDMPLYNYVKINADSLTKLHKPNLFGQWKNLYTKISEIIHAKDAEFRKALNNRIALSIIGLALNETFSEKPFSSKRQKISEILHDDIYQKAYQNLEMKYFPLHWKLFFYAAKYKYATWILFLASTMNFIINRNNSPSKNQDA